FGFPIDLTELMAREREYLVDIPGFEQALLAQRTQSREERKSKQHTVTADDFGDPTAWLRAPDYSADAPYGTFVGYERLDVDTAVVAMRTLSDGRVAVVLAESPFYAESGGQVSDHGTIVGDGWQVDVGEVRKIDGRIAAIGTVAGDVKFGPAIAAIPYARRRDTERHHTATHLLHAALRQVLGEHVHQAGSLVTPDRLRFDFTHHGPLSSEQLAQVEHNVNAGVWASVPVITSERAYADAVASGAMALFGEKYGDVVRVVDIASHSTELCGGTHVRNTAEIGLVRIVNESGVAAGVRRVEAVAGPSAFALLAERDRALVHIAGKLKVNLGGSTAHLEQLERRVDSLVDEARQLEKRLDEAMRGGAAGGGIAAQIVAKASDVAGVQLAVSRVDVGDVKSFQAVADAVRDGLGSGIAVLGAALPDGKGALIVVVTDDLRERGYRADMIVRDIAATFGGRGGGKPHMAQAGVDATQIDTALENARAIATRLSL
ncbi:MAG: alanine--tRNA ligase-related protein, partial [Gemmatimonadota bacterium]|nr:alanine--tRNA ligase-related protein [Gemmatimonadota bacterium]